jgi:hypothetical protein
MDSRFEGALDSAATLAVLMVIIAIRAKGAERNQDVIGAYSNQLGIDAVDRVMAQSLSRRPA